MRYAEDIVWEHGDWHVGEEVRYTADNGVATEVVILELDPENSRAFVEFEDGGGHWVFLNALSEFR